MLLCKAADTWRLLECVCSCHLLYAVAVASVVLLLQDAALASRGTAPHPVKGPVPSIADPDRAWGRSPVLDLNWKRVSHASADTEVHLRRLDAADQLHRRVVAVLTVDASPQEVRSPAVVVTLPDRPLELPSTSAGVTELYKLSCRVAACLNLVLELVWHASMLHV